jgi:hypothetical protein
MRQRCGERIFSQRLLISSDNYSTQPSSRHGTAAQPEIFMIARSVRFGAAALLLQAVTVAAASAQKVGWHATGEANASLFFGAVSQRVAATLASITHTDSAFEGEGSFNFRYGEAADSGGTSFVNARSWLAALQADVRPYARLSPFVLGTVESSLEKGIQIRESGGGGIKYSILHTDKNEASVSLAALGEHTEPRVTSATLTSETIGRWSARVKGKAELAPRVTLTHVTFYKPAMKDFSRYTINSVSELAYALRSSISLTLSFVDNFDSEATLRGARSNNDGQLLFGVRAGL